MEMLILFCCFWFSFEWVLRIKPSDGSRVTCGKNIHWEIKRQHYIRGDAKQKRRSITGQLAAAHDALYLTVLILHRLLDLCHCSICHSLPNPQCFKGVSKDITLYSYSSPRVTVRLIWIIHHANGRHLHFNIKHLCRKKKKHLPKCLKKRGEIDKTQALCPLRLLQTNQRSHFSWIN